MAVAMAAAAATATATSPLLQSMQTSSCQSSTSSSSASLSSSSQAFRGGHVACVRVKGGGGNNSLFSRRSPGRRHVVVPASSEQFADMQDEKQEDSAAALSGVVFEPFSGDLHTKLQAVPAARDSSYARQRYSPACEAAVNEQINVEYNVSYIYHALFAYFDRDNVGLPGFAAYFRHASEEERMHAEELMKYQNLRGGRVKLQSLMMPQINLNDPEKGDALSAMELALSLEKLNNEKLLALHKTAADAGDAQMTDFVEGTFLNEQVAAIKDVSEHVARLRRVGPGHGVYHYDLELLEKFAAAPVAA
ncbi:hypothetical protein CBR_g23292 [Chara braunii]|uniref:Ferritin n=1 Tax=Chara braunii TaxID=69332 RepID=A0A388L3Z2_CHABU|nr:hypothetical protein CBR_g23292 [Chara braunii]|eukprot:GBG76962.1 hypothetical protein CBR_g23292 [Chara braunii]